MCAVKELVTAKSSEVQKTWNLETVYIYEHQAGVRAAYPRFEDNINNSKHIANKHLLST